MNLFSDNFQNINTDKDVDAMVKQHGYDIGYVSYGWCPLFSETKEWLESLWVQYEPYADTHFLDELKRHFIERTWELYLGVTLLNRGFNLGKHRDAGLDFDVLNESGDRVMWIEAIAINAGNGNDRVPSMEPGKSMPVPEKEILLRIASGISTKYEKYLEDLKKIELLNPSDPFVIAINRSSIPFFDCQIPLVLKVLFGIGPEVMSIPVPDVRKQQDCFEPEFYWSPQDEISKKTNATVGMLFFMNNKYSEISAIIYTQDFVTDAPRLPNEMGEQCIIVHNPYAKNPLNSNQIPFGYEYRMVDTCVKLIREPKRRHVHN